MNNFKEKFDACKEISSAGQRSVAPSGSRLGCRCIEQVWNDVRPERDWWCVSVFGGTEEKARSEVKWCLLLLFKLVEEINNLLWGCCFRTLGQILELFFFLLRPIGMIK